jgi:hypothetical protein
VFRQALAERTAACSNSCPHNHRDFVGRRFKMNQM